MTTSYFSISGCQSSLESIKNFNWILGGKVQVCWNVLHLGIVQPEVIFIKRLRNLVQPEDRDAQETGLILPII